MLQEMSREMNFDKLIWFRVELDVDRNKENKNKPFFPLWCRLDLVFSNVWYSYYTFNIKLETLEMILQTKCSDFGGIATEEEGTHSEYAGKNLLIADSRFFLEKVIGTGK